MSAAALKVDDLPLAPDLIERRAMVEKMKAAPDWKGDVISRGLALSVMRGHIVYRDGVCQVTQEGFTANQRRHHAGK